MKLVLMFKGSSWHRQIELVSDNGATVDEAIHGFLAALGENEWMVVGTTEGEIFIRCSEVSFATRA